MHRWLRSSAKGGGGGGGVSLFIAYITLSILDLDYGHIECIRRLVDSGSLVNCQDVSGATPLHYAINAGPEDDVSSDVMMKHLLEHGADTKLPDKYGRLPLHWAANKGT